MEKVKREYVKLTVCAIHQQWQTHPILKLEKLRQRSRFLHWLPTVRWASQILWETLMKVKINLLCALRPLIFSFSRRDTVNILIWPLIETGTATLTLTRQGLYGTIHVPWNSGFPSGGKPEFFTEGQITPPTGSLTIQHGIQTKNFTVSVSWLYLDSKDDYIDCITACL